MLVRAGNGKKICGVVDVWGNGRMVGGGVIRLRVFLKADFWLNGLMISYRRVARVRLGCLVR